MNGREAPAPRSFTVAAAALAWSPVGFAFGALIAGRAFALPAATGGGVVLVAALLGAGLTALIAGVVANRLPASVCRVTTLLAAGVSFALLVYLVRDFLIDRARAAEAFDAAYARMPPFELRVDADHADRRPLSKLVFDSVTRSYVATRPGAWRCRGVGTRRHALALYQGIRALMPEAPAATTRCDVRATWRLADAASARDLGAQREACAAAAPLLAAADAMIRDTARRASCRRGEAADGSSAIDD